MNELKQIQDLLNNVKSKSFFNKLKKYTELINWINEQTNKYNPKSFNERIYILLVSPPQQNECGKYPLFNSYDKGYRKYCGKRSVCQCNQKNHSKEMSALYANMTEEEKSNSYNNKKNGFIEKYGYSNAMKCPEILEKRKLNNIQQYGVATTIERPDVKEKAKQTILEKYSVSHQKQNHEEEIAFWLDSLNIQYKRNIKFYGKTLDFLIGNLALEFNGLYTHSEYSFYGKMLTIDKYYHYNKYKNCKDSNIKLYTIFEDEWLEKSQIIKNKILISLNNGKRGIPARKVSIYKIDAIKAQYFLNQYHLQGSIAGAIFYGAYYNSQLIGVMSFNRRKNDSWELTRFCTDEEIHVGLFSKMLSSFLKEYNPIYLYSFSDNRWSWGEVYVKNGFELEYEIPPDYFVTDYHIRMHKFNWRKSRIAKKYDIDINGKTELDLTLELKHDRIWDCGKIKWKYVNDKR